MIASAAATPPDLLRAINPARNRIFRRGIRAYRDAHHAHLSAPRGYCSIGKPAPVSQRAA